jgi:hypothetical protein
MDHFPGKPNSTLLENAVASITGCVMARRFPSIYLAMFVGALSVGSADARSQSPQDWSLLTPIVNAAPTLTPICFRIDSARLRCDSISTADHGLLRNF